MPGKPKTEAADYERHTVRFPHDLVELLKSEAQEIGRPFNTHIVRTLEALKAKKLHNIRAQSKHRDTATA